MSETSIWKTWKPYAALAVVAVGGGWWYTNQAPFAVLNDGMYDCVGVYVNESGKYEMLTDSAGNGFHAQAIVSGGAMTSITGSAPFALQGTELTFRSKGTGHFIATDDYATRMFNAMACEYSGR